MSDGSGKTNFDLSITIPNTKSRSNLKYNSNYTKLSEYMDVDERMETMLRYKVKIVQEYSNIIIQIKGSINQTIDTSNWIYSMKKLENETESKWSGHFTTYDEYEEIDYNSDNDFNGVEIQYGCE
jgi:hypothetical protein